jgi:hypothetical protein
MKILAIGGPLPSCNDGSIPPFIRNGVTIGKTAGANISVLHCGRINPEKSPRHSPSVQIPSHDASAVVIETPVGVFHESKRLGAVMDLDIFL